MKDIKPVIILGNNRCGTTFLGNLIVQNFEVSTIEHPLHFGILESNIYSYKKYLGDFTNLNNYIHSVEQFVQSDFHILSQLPQDYFYKNRQASFYHLFLSLMDEHARLNYKSAWVTKLDPNLFADKAELALFLNIIKERYKEVKFILIKRNYTDYISSLMNMNGRGKKNVSGGLIRRNVFIGHKAAIYFHNYREMEKLAKENKGLFIRYESIIKDKEQGLKDIGDYLGQEINRDRSSEKDYKRNTSFHSDRSKKKSFSKPAKLWKIIYSILPSFDSFVVRLANKHYLKPPINSPFWWRMKKAKYFKAEFKKELVDMNQAQLVDILDNQSSILHNG